jgi:hypothetical protein
MEGMHRTNMEIPVGCLDLSRKQHYQLTLNRTSPRRLSISLLMAGYMFNAFLSTQSKTYDALCQKKTKGPREKEIGAESAKFERY